MPTKSVKLCYKAQSLSYSAGFDFRNFCQLIFLSALFLSSFPANAGIVSSTGEVAVLSAPPASVVQGGEEDNNITRVFLEKTLTLSSPLTVDYTLPQQYIYGNSPAPGIGIPAGTNLYSYFLDFDPVGAATTPARWSEGSITFDQEIVGVVYRQWLLFETNGVLGAPGTSYPSTMANMGEVDTQYTGDTFTISPDRRTLTFKFGAAPHMDQMRVLVSDHPLATLPVANFGFED